MNFAASRRKAEPHADVTSVLLTEDFDGRPMTDIDFASFFVQLVGAGNDTTKTLTSSGLLALIQHPEQLAELRADPSLIPAAVEEMLRWSNPVHYMRRTTTADTHLGGVPIAAGQKVAMYYTSANRDELVFTDPQRFDIHRSPNRQLAFGFAEHFCLGAHLARLETRVFFEELLNAFESIELAGDPIRLRSNFINGYRQLPVRLELRSGRVRSALKRSVKLSDTHRMEPSEAAGAVLRTSSPVRRLIAADGDFVLTVSPSGLLLAASDSVADELGWDLASCAQHGLLQAVVDEGQQAAVRHLLARVLTTGNARATVQLTGASGRLWVDVAAKQLTDEPGAPIHVSGRDVSHDLAAARELAASEHQWRVAFEHSPIGGAMLSPTGAILVANKALSRMVGWRVDELTQMDVTDIVDARGGLPWQSWWDGLLTGPGDGPSTTTERTLISADGQAVWSRLTGAVVASPPAADRVIMQFEDVTSRRQAELELANRALHDGLTGAPNRFLTHQWLGSALDDQPGSRVGVLYCDLDRFKVVNDSLGHAAGDSLLSQVADRLRAVLRPEDLLGRVGGDEFVVIVEGVRTSAELAEVASRMAEALDDPFELAGHRHAVTLSLGGSIGVHPDSADEVLMRADMALLRAKRLGRARYVAFDPTHDRVTTRADLQLEEDLRLSLGSEQLRAFYQPIVSLCRPVRGRP